MSSLARQQLESWLKTLTNIKGRILDIGGSQQSVIKRLNNTELYIDEYKILDLEVPHEYKEKPDIIYDLNDDIFKVSDKYYWRQCNRQDMEENSALGSSDEVMCQDCAFIDWRKHFDTAFCLEVSEYWWNPVQALSNIHYLLKKNGILYISFHQIYPVHNPVDSDFLRYTPAGITKIMQETGFEILEMKPRLMTTNISSIDGMRPAKGYDKHNWSGCLVKAIKK